MLACTLYIIHQNRESNFSSIPQSFYLFRCLMILTSSKASSTLSLNSFSPSLTYFIGEFSRLPTLRAFNAQTRGNACPN